MRDEHGIQAEKLAREYKGGIKAVDGIDLRIEPGEIYGFLGPNGAGKSTTVHMLTTLLPPTSGTARVAGFDIVKQGPQVRASIGAALQEAALDPFLTGREHLRLQASLHGLSSEERKRRSEELLERVGLTRAADRKIKGYSGGMKRRLDLALALVHEPSTLFLDEPTTGLDPQSRTALWSEVARLAKAEGVTVFLTTQYLEEADVLANRVGIIHRGHIVAEGTPEELKASIGRPTVEVTPADPDQREAIEELLTQLRLADHRRPPDGRRALRAGGRPGRHHPRARRRRPARRPDPDARADARRRLPRQDRHLARGCRRRRRGNGRREERGRGARAGQSVTVSVHQVFEIARRSIVRTLRQPAQIIPNVTFPLLLLAINSNGLRAATHLPGFPTNSFLDFFIPIAFMQGALFASGTAGVDLARDIDNGFLNRLALTPLRGWALLLGQLGGAVALGAIQATVYLGVGIAAGVRFESGVAGAVLLYVLAILIALGFGTLGILIALKTGSGEAVQSAFRSCSSCSSCPR